MTIVELLSHLRSLDVRLWVKGEQLRYNAPHGVMTPTLRAEIVERKAEIIAFLLGDKDGIRTAAASPIQPVSRTEKLPLSFAQERLWFLHELAPPNPAYNLARALRLTGPLDVAALKRSFDEIIRRHEVLRTSFTTVNGRPVQVIAPEKTLALPIVDLRKLSEPEREAQVLQLANTEARRPFDLTQCPFLRTTLLWLDEKAHVLLLTMHHIVFDGWAVDVLFQELGALYEAFSSGKLSPLPELPIQYADFAIWQREWLQDETLETCLAYWKERLRDVPTVLELPADHPRPPMQTFQGATRLFVLSASLFEKLMTLSRQEGVTLFMTLLAAFNTLLYRYTGRENILVGTPTANRNRSEIEGLIGFFVNTLVLRTDLSGTFAFRELLGRVKEVSLGAQAHQDLPFEKLVEALQPERDLSRQPLCQVMFALQNTPARALTLSGLTLDLSVIYHGTSKFDLSLLVEDMGQELKGELEYSTALFEPATITRLVGHFQTLLKGIVANPDQRLADLPLLTEAERHNLLVEWNNTETEYPRGECVHQLFEAQVEQTPDAVAVAFPSTISEGKDQHLTYRQLNQRANRLAHYLQELGVGPDVLVGICLERSLGMVIATLAILKAGGAYVPLDPTYPQERLQFMLEDTRSRVLLTQESLLEKLPEHQVHVVCLDRDWETITQQRATNPVNQALPENTAYVMYTSGSTGIPKGICIPHLAINRLVINTNYVEMGSLDIVAQAANASFDAATFELWGALLCGGKVVLITRDIVLSPQAFAAQIREQKITALFLTTALFNQLAQEVKEPFNSVHDLMFGGQAVDPGSVRIVLEGSAPKRLLHVYGPTESTTYATWYLVEDVPAEATTVPIGGPLANTQVYVLDPHLQPVPVGIPGELFIGGDGLARGYLRRPGLTAERFIPNPFPAARGGDKRAGTRLYRTGDLVRYRTDGNIEFMGRVDFQVKIRGFRVELGEIEAVLAQHPGVQQAAVIAQEQERSGENKRLVAYAVPVGEPAPTTSELRSHLKEKLPEYMIPAVFVFLNALPLTPNKKVDRGALPIPDLARPETESAFVAPRTPAEQILVGIWAHILGIEQVSIHDDFFELGGHSLLATQIMSRVRDAFRVQVPLQVLFEAPTVAGLVEHVEVARRAEQKLHAPPMLVPMAHEDKIPLSFAQQRLWFLDQWEHGSSPFYNIPAALHLDGRLDVAALAQSLGEIIRRHQALRTVFIVVDGAPAQVITPPPAMTLPMVGLQEFDEPGREAQVRRLATEDARRPFDLTQGPLMRATLLQLGAEEHVLLLNIHHIVSDGWSLGILIRELKTFYRAFSIGESSPLPELSIQYADFTVWQRQWLQGEVLETQLAYWKQQLGGDLAVLELPPDRSRPAAQTFQGTIQSFVLPMPLSQALKTLSQKEGATLFMALLAAFKVLLHRYTGQTDVAVGTPIANRNWSEIEDLIGFFVNTLVMRADLSGNPTFRELLSRVREVALGAYAHQDVPFEMLVEALRPERDLSHSPLFQVMFALHNIPTEVLELPDLATRLLDVDDGTAKFDLSLFIWDTARGLKGMLEYNTDLFDDATIARLPDHFQTLLEGIAAKPDRRLSDLPLLTETERHNLLLEWNDTETEHPREQCIHELFAAPAERTPDGVAVVFEGQHLTYQELDCRANQLAHHLQALGGGPDTPVAISVERSLDMVLGVLGILKAGGAYIPLDPAYPQERLAFMLQDAQARVLLTQRRLLEKLPEYTEYTVCLDTDWPEIARMPQTTLPQVVTADNLAYIIYTSGSTGRPKGVAMRHGPLTNLLSWQSETTAIHRPARTLQFASLSFDVSCQEIFFTWSSGGTLILVAEDTQRDAVALLKALHETSVERLFLPFVALQHLAQVAGDPGASMPTNLREVITAGEQLRITPQIESFFNSLEGCTLHNQYGPTEAHVVTAFTLEGRPETWQALPPIGYPIANARIYILDQHLQPTPMGVPGELYIGGLVLVRGYFNRPTLTAERFVPDPFPTDKEEKGGARLYKTGDLARYLPDGTIEFLGRADFQVKVRGFRIEPGEIETVLEQHPGVQEAVVLAREDDALKAGKRLVAYVVVNEARPTGSVLRRFMQEKLPDYMVPSAFVTLEAMPLTPSGKVNRRALPAPERAGFGIEGTIVAPRTPTEEVVASIWMQILNMEQVGIHDNFFELGGHSLLATQLISRVRDAFQIEISLRALFEAPTVAGLAERVEAARRAGLNIRVLPMVPVTHKDNLPLSFAQQRLWFLDQMEPGNVSYNFPSPMHLGGQLNVMALERSLDEVIRRHQALRTTFAVVEGEPVQVIAPFLRVRLPVVDLEGLPEPERDSLAQWLATEDAHRAFDLARGPLVRATLLRLGAEEHVLLLNMHHIVSDGWSAGTLIQELATLYRAFSAGEPSPLPELPIQYADFAVWQRQWLQDEVLETQLAYWKQQLGGALPMLELPTDRPRPAVQTFQGAIRSFLLPQTLSRALKALSREERVTLFMTLLAAFKVLLHRYTRQTDVAVGTPIANRNWSEIEDLIGFFVNTLVMRADLSGNPTFRELLSRVREVALGAYARQDLPFEKLLGELQPERDLSHSPLFQVMFVLQNVPRPVQDLSGLTLNPFDIDIRSAKFDLTLSMRDTEQGLSGVLNYQTDLFDADTMDRLIAHFQVLLAGIAAHPDRQLADLPLLTEAEQHRMLVAWNNTQADYPGDACLHELFEAQARRTPNQAAVVFESQSLTYQELDERANRLAHHLQRLGVGPEAPVGICVERSTEMIVGILGILKAGGVYVPLDPMYPKDRLAFMLDDAQVSVLLTQQQLIENLPEHPAQIVCLDAHWGVIAQESAEKPPGEVASENPVYIIYTSGSTSRPKGVMIPHRAVVNHALALVKTCDLDPGHRLLQFISLSFDASAEEIFPVLISGATLVLPGAATEMLGRNLLQFCEQEDITILHLPVPVWHQWVDDATSNPTPLLPSLKTLLVGGESADVNRLQTWACLIGRQTRFVHCYGPTEATITVSIYETTSDTKAIAGLLKVPIGHPIANVQAHLLDDHLQPVPIGVPGELCISGAGVGRGYLNRPNLTAEKFIPNPFSREPGSRLYHSGDLARYLPDGNVEFLGRVDDQIKMRGFRVEPGEIETALNQHQAVQESLVVARGDGADRKELVAYLVANQGAATSVGELRRSLRENLPDYMIPTAFITLDAFPLTAHGKVDRRALPAPDCARVERESTFVAPGTPYEEILAEIWEEVLQLEKIGVHDNFFDLGGHSLLVTQVVSRVCDRFEIELPVRSLFEAPTIAEMGTRIEQTLVARIAALDGDEVIRLLESEASEF